METISFLAKLVKDIFSDHLPIIFVVGKIKDATCRNMKIYILLRICCSLVFCVLILKFILELKALRRHPFCSYLDSNNFLNRL
ncbi:unnamed protein product [Moneuplotes crassus]|uniref:Uncharacterized protein n=1 Tax=Euplotes crassus TaxID=5936 RepID=A0AAD1U5P1_EUPCR|nr:unnamed protein product [Moneuplotes crassus]